MEADTARLESGIANAEAMIFNLNKEIETLKDALRGKIQQNISVPSGLPGFNFTYEVLAQPLGTEPAEEGAGSVAGGAFYRLFLDAAGDTYLQGGTVTGGNGGSATIADEKVLDAETGVGTLAGKVLFLEVTCNATVDSGIMLPGCAVTAADIPAAAAAVPANQAFTAAAPTGKKLYLELGRWTETTFLPAAPGNILASGCIGNFALTRV